MNDLIKQIEALKLEDNSAFDRFTHVNVAAYINKALDKVLEVAEGYITEIIYVKDKGAVCKECGHRMSTIGYYCYNCGRRIER